MTFHYWVFRWLGITATLPGIPNDQNTQLFYWVFWSLGIPYSYHRALILQPNFDLPIKSVFIKNM